MQNPFSGPHTADGHRDAGWTALFPAVSLGKNCGRGPRRTPRTGRCAGLRAHESPRNQTAANMNLREIAVEFHARSQHSCGLAGFCRPD